ncbi:MAG: GNAT family N-acetyltransferase [Chloroflexota bacterium]
MTASAVSPTPGPFELRAIQTEDHAAVRAFLDRLSPSTVRSRYLHSSMKLAGPSGEREITRLLADHAGKHVVVLAVDGAEIRGIGELFNLPLERADVGLVVEDGFQGRGIGRDLLQALIQVARKQGIRALTGDMAYGNERAVALLRGTGRQLQLRVGGGGVQFSLLLQA